MTYYIKCVVVNNDVNYRLPVSEGRHVREYLQDTREVSDDKMKYILAFLCWTLIPLSEQSVDLNLRQLQFVSDHLTPKECDELALALTETGVQVLLLLLAITFTTLHSCSFLLSLYLFYTVLFSSTIT